MELKFLIHCKENIIPKGCRKPREVVVEKEYIMNIPEITKEANFLLIYQYPDRCNNIKTIRWYNGEKYEEIRENDIYSKKSYNIRSYKEIVNTINARKYIYFNDSIWATTHREAGYSIKSYCSDGVLYKALEIREFYPDMCTYDLEIFRADEYELAIKYFNEYEGVVKKELEKEIIYDRIDKSSFLPYENRAILSIKEYIDNVLNILFHRHLITTSEKISIYNIIIPIFWAKFKNKLAPIASIGSMESVIRKEIEDLLIAKLLN